MQLLNLQLSIALEIKFHCCNTFIDKGDPWREFYGIVRIESWKLEKGPCHWAIPALINASQRQNSWLICQRHCLPRQELYRMVLTVRMVRIFGVQSLTAYQHQEQYRRRIVSYWVSTLLISAGLGPLEVVRSDWFHLLSQTTRFQVRTIQANQL